MKDILYAIAFSVGLIAGTVLLALVIPARAMEATEDGFKLTPTELARCANGGGCVVIPYADMEFEMAKWMKKAYDAGRAEACRGI